MRKACEENAFQMLMGTPFNAPRELPCLSMAQPHANWI